MHEVNPTSLWKKKPVHIACTTISGGLSKTWAALAKKWHNFWTHEANFHNTILIHALAMQKLQLQKKNRQKFLKFNEAISDITTIENAIWM